VERVIAKRSARRKRLIARRARPDLEFFFNRYERRRRGMSLPDAGSRSDLYELETRTRLQDRR
jgi:hypothetical protein